MSLKDELHAAEHLVTVDVPDDVSGGIEGLTATFRRLPPHVHAKLSETVETGHQILEHMLVRLSVVDDHLEYADIDWDEFQPELAQFLVTLATHLQTQGFNAAGKAFRALRLTTSQGAVNGETFRQNFERGISASDTGSVIATTR